MDTSPGLVVLFGSGETSASGRKVFDWLFSRLSRRPLRAAVLETPAGFQPNSALVAGKVADFLRHNLGNHRPEVVVVPARQRGTPDSPDAPEVVAPVLSAEVIFLGPGSPTYAVRQLRDSLAWQSVVACQRLGAALVLASAATIAASARALPVYEIYKAGEDLHWQAGLDLFGAYGLELVFVPHWNNREGGAELDTSHCFMGQARFERLLAMLPPTATVVGIDEHTALLVDTAAGELRAMGRGCVTILRAGREEHCGGGRAFPLDTLGAFRLPEGEADLPAVVWQSARAARLPGTLTESGPPPDVTALVQEREAARARRDWATADTLRGRIAALGWQVRDTPEGPRVVCGDGGRPGGSGGN